MAKKTTKKQLGKGLSALLSNINAEIEENEEKVIKTLSNNFAAIPLAQIEVNKYQPRQDFDAEALAELATSIKVHGLIQPITVTRIADGKYQLISGERRFRASKLAQLEEIPAYIRIANDQELMEMALIENIQRENLNAIEIGLTYQRLKEEFQLTDSQLSERIGKSRSAITNSMRLLTLPPAIQLGVREGKISMGHARALAGVKDIALQSSIYNQIIAERLSVRQTEELIAPKKASKKATKKNTNTLPLAFQTVQTNLKNYLGAKVALKRQDNGTGHITINFANDEDLNRILELIEKE